jgi:RHS repeat-associated protein
MTYDKEGQLTNWYSGNDTIAWTLDSRGNWTNIQSNGADSEIRTFNGTNELSTRIVNGIPQAVTQDNLGQLTALDGNTYSWSEDQKLESMNEATVLYDGLGRVVRRISSGNVIDYRYDGWQVIRETRSGIAGVSVVDYTYGPRHIDEILAMHVTNANSSNSYWFLRDQNMNVAGVTNSSGLVVEKYTTGPYGKVRIYDAQGNSLVSSIIGNTRFFQGLEKIGSLYANRYRWVSEELGRYISREPLRPFKGDVANNYRWLHNGPFGLTDSYGLEFDAKVKYFTKYEGLPWGETLPPNINFDFNCSGSGCKYEMSSKVDPGMIFYKVANKFSFMGELCKRTADNIQRTADHELMHVGSLESELAAIQAGFAGTFKSQADCQAKGALLKANAEAEWAKVMNKEAGHDNGLSPGTTQFARSIYQEYLDSFNAGLCGE